VVVESQPGAGAIFRIYLPRYVELAAEKEAAAARPEKKEKPRDLTGTGTVLLVEDEDAVRTFAKAALASRGYRVFEAANGVDALEVMEEHASEIDLVVSDVVMPEMDGPALLKRLRQDHPDLKFILMSGYAEDAFRGTISGDEKFAFLPKPFSLKQLAAAVKESLSAPE
jgi:two-component system cell cycle sensor histidine kinase/response regulator CckA